MSDDFKTIAAAKKQLTEAAFGKDKAAQVEQFRVDMAKCNYETRKNQLQAQEAILNKRVDLIKGIDKFWPTTINKSALQQSLEEKDMDALSYLTDLTLKRGEDIREYTLTFTFAENPYFSDSTLVKKVSVPAAVKKEAPYDLEVPTECDSIKISWKDDEHNLVKASPRPDLDKMEEYDELESLGSFFNFFTSKADDVNTAELFEHIFENALDIYSDFGNLDEEEDDLDDDEELESEDNADEVDLGDSESEMPSKKKHKK